VAFIGATLHEPFDVTRQHAKLMLQDSTGPECGRLLVFRHTDPLALEVITLEDPAVRAHHNAGVKKMRKV